MDEPETTERSHGGWRRVLAAGAVGLLGAIGIWVAAPYKNYYIGGAFISDDFLPIGALFIILVIVMAINPLLRLVRPSLSLDASQLAIVFAIVLVAGVASGNGALRQIPYAIARIPVDVNASGSLSKAYRQMDLPAFLFPDEIGHNKDAPVGRDFLAELPPGEPIPWGKWVGPLLGWGSMLLFIHLMMVGLAMIVLPQWQRNERLPFPLLAVQQSLIESPGKGKLFAPLFRKRSFWVGALAVMSLHMLAGAHIYQPSSVPAIPLNWDIRPMFTEEPWLYLPIHLTVCRIYFIFIGIAYFMPNRIGFSMWFFVVAYGIYVALSLAYAPPFYAVAIDDQKTGAMFVIAAGVLWLGRSHWARVFGCLLGRVTTDEDRRDRTAAIMFLSGCLGIFAWLVHVGRLDPRWAAAYLGMGFTICLLITRVIAETGLSFLRINAIYPHMVAKMAPSAWLSPTAMFFGWVMTSLFIVTSRTSMSVHAAHGLALDKESNPRRQSRLGPFLVFVVMLGIVISGATHLQMNYRHSASIDGTQQPINLFGTMQFAWSHPDLLSVVEGRPNRVVYNQMAHVGFGAGLAGVLQALCLMTPKWPIHPLGMFLVHSWHGQQLWPNLLIGWLLKILILRYGGARLYTAGRPLFMGLIMGEVFAVVIWSLVTVVLASMGLPVEYVPILPT